MLCELSIKNFAIIDDLKIRFSEGLTILSGETGAGKSIIINAINLLLGSRASSRLIRKGAEFAELEALFDITAESQAFRLMKETGYDPKDGLLIKRIIASNDRHRIYINGSIATIQILTSITENLVSISGQHAHQGLLREDNHLLILDQYGKLMSLREHVKTCFQDIQPLIRKLKVLEDSQKHQTEQTDLIEFQKQEILSAAIKDGEDDALENEKSRLKHSEFLYQTVNTSIETLYRGDGSVIEKISEIKKMIDRAGEIDATLALHAASLDDVVYRIEDISDALRHYIEDIQMDTGRLDDVESRLDMLNKLKRKYGGKQGTLQDVINQYNDICIRLEEFENISESIEETKQDLMTCHKRLSELAGALSEKRKQAALGLSKKIEKELSALEMKDTLFQVDFDSIQVEKHVSPFLQTNNQLLTDTGLDVARFMIAPNVGEEIKHLAAIASGGELSRVVLALKSILAENDDVGTVIFDEVDAGIGGGVAEVLGQKMSRLARFHQIICITHLPQIAKFGHNHYKISKQVKNGRTIALIHPLDKKERVEEIARMLGGVEITNTTLAHAREILRTAD
ncbi:MAG: DNA repair protein RecN [Proteobacteria bacterium]|nr:DNA repair protein RecN [Pseudomonadota bacterium]